MVLIPLITSTQIIVYAFLGILLIMLGVAGFLMYGAVRDHTKYHKTALPDLNKKEETGEEEFISSFNLDHLDDEDNVEPEAFLSSENDGDTGDLSGKQASSPVINLSSKKEKKKFGFFQKNKDGSDSAKRQKKSDKDEFKQKEIGSLFDVDSAADKIEAESPAGGEDFNPFADEEEIVRNHSSEQVQQLDHDPLDGPKPLAPSRASLLEEEEDDDFMPVIASNSAFGESGMHDFELKEIAGSNDAGFGSSNPMAKIQLPGETFVGDEEEEKSSYAPRRARD